MLKLFLSKPSTNLGVLMQSHVVHNSKRYGFVERHLVTVLSRHLVSNKIQRLCEFRRLTPASFSYRTSCCAGKLESVKGYRTDATNMTTDSQSLSTEEGRVKRMVCLYIGYIGTDYYGLQVNRQEGIKTIEEELEKALYACGWIAEKNFQRVQKLSWSRASRTDKGVHACGNVIALKALIKEHWFEPSRDPEKTRWSLRTKNNSDELAFSSLGPLKKDILEQLNRNLPDSIRILGVEPVTKHFDARSRCNFRAYEYLMPIEAIPGSSDNLQKSVRQLEDILSIFKGTHRFHNFSSGLRAAHKKGNSRLDASKSVKEDVSTKVTMDEQATSTQTVSEEINEYNEEVDKASEDNQDSQYSDYLCKVIRQWPEHSSHRLTRQEYIRSVYIADIEGPLQIQGRSYVILRFAGQSFILHQIRKMIGGALSVMYGRLSLDALKAALHGPYQVPISLAPSEPLMLVLCDFWNPKRERYELIPSHSTQEALKYFKYNTLLPRVANLLLEKRPFERFYVEGLYDYGGQENLQRLIAKVQEWEEKRKQRKLQNVEENQVTYSISSHSKDAKTRGTERPFPPKLFTQLAVELRMLPGPELCRLRQVLIDARKGGRISHNPSTEECIQYLKQKQYL